ncbi:MAG: hypothetical protein IKO47_05470 [Ruminococcus sp.]|nr:hypothetical protein [Ruminococcus sp.]
MGKPELIVMLTYNDCTVENAFEIFSKCSDSKAKYWGFKEKPLPLDEMKRLYAYMKECGKTTVLEVVEYTEEEGINGAETAVECGCDILMGTMYSDKISEICRKNGIKYMPFVGDVYDRPSVLGGTVEGMIAEARDCISKGCAGIDLLGYRFTGDPVELNRRLVEEIDADICIAGSVNSFERLDEICDASPWAFTIGSAFFDKQFGTDFCEQINTVCDYVQRRLAVIC